jgi:hypothetical protein
VLPEHDDFAVVVLVDLLERTALDDITTEVDVAEDRGIALRTCRSRRQP